MKESSPATLFEAAIGHHQAGRLVLAEQMYRKLLGDYPNDARALSSLGMLMDQTGRQAEAISLLGRAIAIDGQPAHYHTNLGEALRKSGRLPEAIASFREAIARDRKPPGRPL